MTEERVDQSLLEAVAACPICHGGLDWGAALRCASCGRSFHRAANGAPLLLISEAPVVDEDWYPGALRVLPRRIRSVAERHRSRLCPDLVYRSPARRDMANHFVATFGRMAPVVNVGSGLLRYGPNVVNIEVEALPGVDLVGVAEQLPLVDGALEGAMLQAVLEHVRSAHLTLTELHRVLRPGGRLFIDVPFIQGYHPGPGDYRRYTEQGLRTELTDHGFDVEESGVALGPGSAMAWITAEFLAFLVSGRSANVYRIARPISRWLALPIKYTDRWLDTHPMAYVIPSSVWARARCRK